MPQTGHSTSSFEALRNFAEVMTFTDFVALLTFGFAIILIMQFAYLRLIKNRNKIKLFYSDEDEPISIDRNELVKITHLFEKQLADLQQKVDALSGSNIREMTQVQMEQYVKDNIQQVATDALQNSDIVETEIKQKFDEYLLSEINSYLKTLTAEEMTSIHSNNETAQQSAFALDNLDRIMERERSSSSLMKQIMINLFILVNFGLLITYFFVLKSINQYTALAITGLYISLAAFIIYIFRSSNSRTATLLAIREDMKNQLIAVDFVNRKKTGILTDQDIEYIKLILTNHAEREKQTKHPYEVILKGVSGSNIQLGNGKFSASKAAPEKGKS